MESQDLDASAERFGQKALRTKLSNESKVFLTWIPFAVQPCINVWMA